MPVPGFGDGLGERVEGQRELRPNVVTERETPNWRACGGRGGWQGCAGRFGRTGWRSTGVKFTDASTHVAYLQCLGASHSLFGNVNGSQH